MKTLLIYPERLANTRSWAHKLGLQLKKNHSEPLELIEISIEFPITWERKFLDLNVEKLREKDIRGVDYIFVRADTDQEDSVRNIVRLCKKMNKKVVAIGPLFRSSIESFAGIDHFILSENELTRFTYDLENREAKAIYGTDYIHKPRRICKEESSLVGFSGNLMRSLQLVS